MIKKSVLLTALAITGFAVTSLAQTVSNYVPTNGLVSWWPFNGNAIDESVNTNDGTVSGTTILTSDRFSNINSAFIWDGSNSPITVTNNSTQNFQTGITFSVWLYQTGMYCSGCAETNYLSKGRDINLGGIALGLDHTSQKFCFTVTGNPVSTTPPNSYFLSASTINYNTWTNLIATYDGNVINIYINGVLNKSYNYNSIIPINTENILIGKQKGTGVYSDNYNMLGKLDDIGIWNRALTPSEITGLYNGNLCFQTITVTDTLLINTNITGFNPVTYQNTIKIWPNPTNDHITIDNGNLANLAGHQIKISNALGQQVFQSAITQQQFYVNMSTWGGNGIYFVNLINAQGVTIETRKIVLQ
jgi:hypothetical protein